MRRRDEAGLDRIWAALKAVGRLTPDQAARLTGWPPRTVGRRLRRLVDAGLLVSFQRAYWHPRVSRRGSLHRALVAEMYVRLAPLAPHWRFETAEEGGYRPDGWLVADTPPPVRVALEADRGTEREPAWHEKLRRYREAGPAGLLVAVPDERRADRVGSWIREVGIDALVLPVAKLTPERAAPYLRDRRPDRSAARAPLPPGGDRRVDIFVDGIAVNHEHIDALSPHLHRALAVERLAGRDVWHVVSRPPESRVVRWLRERLLGRSSSRRELFGRSAPP